MLSFALLNEGDELTEIQWMTTFFMIFPLFSFLWTYQEVIHYIPEDVIQSSKDYGSTHRK
jgi:hypothetical protein